MIVQQPWHDCLARTRPAADLARRLQHGDMPIRPGPGHSRGEPIGAAADDDRGARHT